MTDVVAEIVGRLGVNKRPVQCNRASTEAFEWPRVRILGRQEDRQLLKLQVRMRVYEQLDVQGNTKPIGETRVVEHRSRDRTYFFPLFLSLSLLDAPL